MWRQVSAIVSVNAYETTRPPTTASFCQVLLVLSALVPGTRMDPRGTSPAMTEKSGRRQCALRLYDSFLLARSGRDGKVQPRMTVLTTSLDRRSEAFAANAAAMRALVEDL